MSKHPGHFPARIRLILALAALAGPAQAYEIPWNHSHPAIQSNLFARVGVEAVNLAASPLAWGWKDLLWVAPCSAALGLAIWQDSRLYQGYQDAVNTAPGFWPGMPAALDTGAGWITQGGDTWVLLGLTGVLGAAGGPREKDAAMRLVEGIGVTGLYVGGLKLLFFTNRPYEEIATPPVHRWFRYFNANQGFPSGHTAMAFCVAGVLADAYGLPWLFYPAAGLVGLSRIHLAKHWPSDVLAGALLGLLAARQVDLLHGRLGRVAPLVTRDASGLSWHHTF